jgi:cobaltochelatase CobN
VEINDTINDIRNNLEWYSILSALDGGYVEPGLAADPLYSDVLPTGRAMYVGDTSKIPSKSAWQSAVNSIDDVLVKYMVNLGEESFPELIGEVIWGTEALRTEGISLAQFMYLLGVKPVWDKTGTVTGVEVIPLENLTVTIDSTVYQRPRIDVFSTLVCNNPYWLGLLTKSVELVNSLNESTTVNYVKKHYEETGSLERLFGLPGAILEGTGVSDLLNNKGTTLDNASGIAEELASVYESRIGHSWNVDDEGNIVVQDNGEAFAYLLEHVDLVIQDLDSTWRYLDSDDYLDWFGGLVNAATVHGTVVNTVLLDIRDKNTVVTSTLGEEVKKETRTTILNPQWLADMTDEVGGWNQMSTNFENLMKTMLTTQNYKENQEGKAIIDTSEGNNAGIIGDGLLRETAKTVTYSEYFNINAQYKSYAFQSMSGWLLTADMAGYWKTNDNTLRKDLLQKYVDNANRYGVACCHHTCGNINFHEWVMKTGTSLGVKGLSEYSVQYASATKNPNAAYTEYTSGTPTPSSDGTGNVDIGEGIGEYANDGATEESNAMAMAGQGAQGLADSASNTGSASVMAAGNNFGTGTSASGQSGGNGQGIGTGNGTGTGEGSGDGNDTKNSGNSTGNGTNATTGDTNQTSQDGQQNGTKDDNGNSTNEHNTTTDQNSTNSQVNQNTTQTDGSDSNAGDQPETDPASTVDTSSSEIAITGSSSAGGQSGE